MRTEPAPSEWEVWHARFDYDGGKGYKYRPVIVLRTNSEESMVVMVTGADNKASFPHDYVIRDWEDAGLDKPSLARVDRIAIVPRRYLGTAMRIGRLTPEDINGIESMLQVALADQRGS